MVGWKAGIVVISVLVCALISTTATAGLDEENLINTTNPKVQGSYSDDAVPHAVSIDKLSTMTKRKETQPVILTNVSHPETQTLNLKNVSHAFPMFSNAEYVYFTIGEDMITLTLDTNASFDGICNLSALMGRDVSVAGSHAELNYTTITYQNITYDQKWELAPYYNETEHKLYLLSGSGLLTAFTLSMEEDTTKMNKTIPKVVGVGDLCGKFSIETTTDARDSTYNWLDADINGVGYLDLYAQYAPDTSYNNVTYLPTFSQCEKLQVKTSSYSYSYSGSESMVSIADLGFLIITRDSYTSYGADIQGFANGSVPIIGVSPGDIKFVFDVEYFPITYQNITYDQKWELSPYYNETEHKLYLLSGSGFIPAFTLSMEEDTTKINKTIPKVVGVGDLCGQFHIETTTEAEARDSTYNWLDADIKGVGYLDLYAQYAPDTSYNNVTFIPSFSQCEKLQVETSSYSYSGSESMETIADVLGFANGRVPIIGVSPGDIKFVFDVEYFPIIYQNITYDQKWELAPYYNETEHKRYLLSGSGFIPAFTLSMEEDTTKINKTIPKVVGVGDLCGQFHIETTTDARDSTYNWLDADINGVGYLDIYAQYAPDTSYNNVTYLPTFSQCEKLQVKTSSYSYSGSESMETISDVLGFANGRVPIIGVSPGDIKFVFDVEYFPITYQNITYDQKWELAPYYNETEHKLYLLSGSGLIPAFTLSMEEDTTKINKTIPKVVGVGDLCGKFSIETTTEAEARDSTYNWLDADINGVGYLDIYAQYAPDTSYNNVTYLPTFSQCEKLQLSTHTYGSSLAYIANVLGYANSVEYLKFNNNPLDNVAINETFDLEYHPVNRSCNLFNEKWSVKPMQHGDTLVLLRGTGNVTVLNFTIDDRNAAHPEIISYGNLSGEYNITTTILPHYMNIIANGTDVAAMDESGEGGFGITFKGGKTG